MEYSVNNHPPMGFFTFIPSVDEDILPDRQSVLYKAGKFAKGPSYCLFSPLLKECHFEVGASNTLQVCL